MNRSNAATLGGGAHMNRLTSGDVSSAYKASASDGRRSRRVMPSPRSSGSPSRQSLAAVSVPPDHRVSPNNGTAPRERGGNAPFHSVAPDDVAPDDGLRPQRLADVGGVAPDHRVPPDDRLPPGPRLTIDRRRGRELHVSV